MNSKMANAWDRFPNAKHIDRIMQSLKDIPAVWSESWIDSRTLVKAEDLNLARRLARQAAGNKVGNPAIINDRPADMSITVWITSEQAVRDSILSLIAWDDCAYLLDMDPILVQKMALLGPRVQAAAILLLPAAMVFQKEAV